MTFELLNEYWNSPTIKEQYLKLNEDLNSIRYQIANLQAICPHTNIKAIAKCDTGNWSKDDDSYWIDWKCEDCGDGGTVYNDSPYYKGMLKYV